MGAYLARVYAMFWKERSIVIVGLDGAGKTTVLYNLQFGEEIENTVPTLGFNVENLQVNKAKFKAWDLGGQHRLRELWHYYYEEIDGIVFVIDSVDKDRFPEARDELHKILRNPKLSELPVLILANKQDISMAAGKTEIVEALGYGMFAKDNIHVVECSARFNQRVNLAFEWLVSAF